MKKVLRHPLIVITAIGIIFMLGVLFGRYTTKSVLQFIQNDGSVTKETVDTSANDEIISSPLKGKININTADLETLCQLPGIGEVSAQRIIDYREANGPFLTIEEIKNVDGFGNKRFDAIKPYVTTGYLSE